MAQVVVTFIGDDRPGIIDRISKTVNQSGGSWAASRMCRLAGKFSGVLLIECPNGESEALSQKIQSLAEDGLTLLVESGSDEKSLPHDATIEVVGNDRPGIVKEISGLIAEQGINVLELKTDVISAPMAGTHLFEAEFRISEKDAAKREAACDQIEALASDLMVEIKIIKT